MELSKLGGIQRSYGVGHSGWFADSMWVDSSDSEVVGVSFEQPGHGVFTDLNGVIVALDPVVGSNLTSTKSGAKQKQVNLDWRLQHIDRVEFKVNASYWTEYWKSFLCVYLHVLSHVLDEC